MVGILDVILMGSGTHLLSQHTQHFFDSFVCPLEHLRVPAPARGALPWKPWKRKRVFPENPAIQVFQLNLGLFQCSVPALDGLEEPEVDLMAIQVVRNREDVVPVMNP